MRNRIAKTLTFILLTLTLTSGLAQLPLWSLPNQTIDMVTFTTSPLPTATTYPGTTNPISWPSGYDGRAAEHAHNAMHDANGDLLFFIIDGYIFDKNGYLMSDEMQGLGDGQISIVPVPENCNQFYIIGNEVTMTASCQGTFGHRLYCGTLDLTLPWGLVAPQGGMVNNSLTDLRGLLTQLAYPNNPASSSTLADAYWPYHPKIRGVSYAITPVDSNGDRFMFVQTRNAIFRYKISQAGISYDNYFWKGTQSLISSLEPCSGYSLTEEYESNEMEVKIMPDGSYRLAFEMILIGAPAYGGVNSTILTPAIAVIDVDGNTKNLVSSSLNLIPYDYYEYLGIANRGFFLKGLEFSPSGNFLYISHPASPQHPNCLEVYDVAGHSFVSNFNVGNMSAYRNSQLEIGYDGNLYMANATTLAKVSNPDSPVSSVFSVIQTINLPAYYGDHIACPSVAIQHKDTTYILPSQIDGEDPFSRFSQSCCNVVDAVAENYTAPIGYQTWSLGSNPFSNATNQVQVMNYIRIPTGANVHINNMTFLFDQGARMVIEKGARVYLNNTLLTSDACNGIMWEGVRVEGNSNANQSINNQGYLSMYNNSEISNAYIGVALHKRDLNNNIDWSTNGGRIRANNSTFKNNRRDVIFLSYNNYNSLSSFNNCDFITDSYPLADGVSTPNVHVSMLAVKNIKFKGCRFNNTTNSSNLATRGKGIVSIDAGYEVTYQCTAFVPYYSPCPINSRIASSFSNLEYGIDARNANLGIANTITVKYAEFNENNRAAHMGSIRNFKFVNNSVNVGIPTAPSHGWPYGLYSNSSTGYTIENNLFKTQHTGESYGVIVSNSNNQGTNADVNEVYHNTFEDLNYGAYNLGENVQRQNGNSVVNTGLTYRCNDFSGSTKNDVYEGAFWIFTGGVSPYQGSCVTVSSPSNNLYSAVNPNDSNWWNNNGNNLSYQRGLWIGANGPSRLEPTLQNSAITQNLFCSNIDYDPALSCPVKRFDLPSFKPWIMGGKIAQLKATVKDDKELLEKVDLEVSELWEQALLENENDYWAYFRTQLVNEYTPYVSLEMLDNIINEAKDIPHGYIKEIIVNSYPLTEQTIRTVKKSELSETVKGQILEMNFEGENTRLKLESTVTYYHREIAYLERDINQFHLSDSTIETGLDSIVLIYEQKEGLEAKKQLVTYCFGNNNYEQASLLLDDIYEEEGESDFVQYYNVLLANADNKMYQLAKGTNDYTTIKNLADPTYATFIGSQAAHLLEYLSGERIEEVEPIILKSGYAPAPVENYRTDKNDNVIIYPNPTSGVLTIELLLGNTDEVANVIVLDEVGKIVERAEISNAKSYIDISSLASGVYFLKIEGNNGLSIMKKIIKE